ncbi:AAA family ATPase [Rugamonas fusca]|uniref:AAA family ATPase n=1 Tax=Rugamonas fusca TaxID=2758568 RepID=UPI00288323C6|nr:AAA family ATPase [Rugamonas fusca]
MPLPKANSNVLETLNYPSVVYIAANADRIEPNKDDFSPRKVRAARNDIITAANQIFCTDKFDALKTINVRKGVGNSAFLIELPSVGKQKKSYFSEKNLSLGELCILKLLKMLADCPRGSLVLIDELELALHPTAQTELLKYLEQIAGEKNLTVIVSTHSATLIKQAARRQILFLQAGEDGKVSCAENCFPSFVLGALAYREEAASDVVIYVEDEAARIVVEQLSRRFIGDQFRDAATVPSVNAIPVGGFVNVIRFFVRQKPLLPSVTRAYVMLDADAEPLLDNAQVEDIVRIYRNERASISFLPFTPEVGLVRFLVDHRAATLTKLRQHFMLNTLSLRAVDLAQAPAPGVANERDLCKAVVDSICTLLTDQLPNTSESEVRGTLFKLLAEHVFATERPQVMRLFGPVIRG